MLTPVAGDGFAFHDAAVTGVATVVVHRVGIQFFTPAPRLVNPETIAVARHRREVAGNDNLIAGFITAHKDKDRTFVIIHHQPFKAVGVKIQLVQRFMVAIGMVQIAYQALDAVMPVIAAFQQMPVQAAIVVPLPPWANSLPINSSFFPGKANIQP